MDYQKTYNSIIQKAKTENRIKLRKNKLNYIYYERHHILPRCLNGSDDESNLVLLTPKEHFLCHKLLVLIYPGNWGIICAFRFMSLYDNKTKRRKSSREYSFIKELYANTPMSQKHRENIGKGQKGRISPMKGKRHTIKTREKIRTTCKDKNTIQHLLNYINENGAWNKNKKGIYSEEYLKKLRIPNTEKQNLHVKEAMNKMLNIQCPFCKKIMNNSNGAYTLYHGNKCKLNPTNINSV